MISLPANWSKIRKRKLFVATPVYGGMLHAGFHNSVISLILLCAKQGVSIGTKVTGDSLVPRARNRLVAHFLDSDCSDILFVDADIAFSAEDAISLLAFDEAVIGGMYSRKQIDWVRIRRAAMSGVPAEELPRFGTMPVLNWSRTPADIRLDALYDGIKHLGTGFLRIRREVFTKMIQHYGEEIQFDYHSDEDLFRGRVGYEFFPSGIDKRYALGSGSRQYLSEDWFFAERAVECGFKLHAAPWIRLIHHGAYDYENDLSVMTDRVPVDSAALAEAKPVPDALPFSMPTPTVIASPTDGQVRGDPA